MRFNNKKKNGLLLKVIFAFGILVIAGCAVSLPPTEKLKSETATFQLPRLPQTGQAVVYVVRPSALGKTVRISVRVGDTKVGSTKGNQYIYFDLPSGEHIISSKAENTSKINISAKDGEIIFLQQEISFGALFARNTLKRIEELEGKYYVKKLKLGKINTK